MTPEAKDMEKDMAVEGREDEMLTLQWYKGELLGPPRMAPLQIGADNC